jgi:hypothetical protein
MPAADPGLDGPGGPAAIAAWKKNDGPAGQCRDGRGAAFATGKSQTQQRDRRLSVLRTEGHAIVRPRSEDPGFQRLPKVRSR